MSYEIYLDVRHHPRHLEYDERKNTSCTRYVEPDKSDPTDAERMRAVVNFLRETADDWDPDVCCTHCWDLRHQHYDYPSAIVRCFNRYGPITQYAWWEAAVIE